jgi:hypothetical protein
MFRRKRNTGHLILFQRHLYGRRRYSTNILVNLLQKRERQRSRIHAEYKIDANEQPDVSALFLSTVKNRFITTLASA